MVFLISAGSWLEGNESLTFTIFSLMFPTSLIFMGMNLHILPSLSFQQGIIFVCRLKQGLGIFRGYTMVSVWHICSHERSSGAFSLANRLTCSTDSMRALEILGTVLQLSNLSGSVWQCQHTPIFQSGGKKCFELSFLSRFEGFQYPTYFLCKWHSSTVVFFIQYAQS